MVPIILEHFERIIGTGQQPARPVGGKDCSSVLAGQPLPPRAEAVREPDNVKDAARSRRRSPIQCSKEGDPDVGIRTFASADMAMRPISSHEVDRSLII
ncbi:hypothetical protein ColLi_09160 [Colletotrichum liriopes]|uniref:Uncharacterized protein n=1 Tax=Colletotrichum liriopes TaxID=708192 RepID=A0AA37LVT0_9PEZI|nr:hypothetical protein ColLi_09160 [Colletotrichum liriopes]